MMMLKRSALMGLIMVMLAACGERGVTEPPAEEFPRMRNGNVVFYFVPRANHTVQSIVVAGSFGAEGTPQFWNPGNQEFAMTRRADGTWELARQLPSGSYQYKFVFNGDQWAGNMCNDATWGNPAHANRVDPAVTACTDDGFGGANGTVAVP